MSYPVPSDEVDLLNKGLINERGDPTTDVDDSFLVSQGDLDGRLPDTPQGLDTTAPKPFGLPSTLETLPIADESFSPLILVDDVSTPLPTDQVLNSEAIKPGSNLAEYLAVTTDGSARTPRATPLKEDASVLQGLEDVPEDTEPETVLDDVLDDVEDEGPVEPLEDELKDDEASINPEKAHEEVVEAEEELQVAQVEAAIADLKADEAAGRADLKAADLLGDEGVDVSYDDALEAVGMTSKEEMPSDVQAEPRLDDRDSAYDDDDDDEDDNDSIDKIASKAVEDSSKDTGELNDAHFSPCLSPCLTRS